MSEGIRFLQISDLHLGGRAYPRCFDLSAEQERLRNDELRSSLRKLVDIARANEVEIVLIPGDLFDRESAHNDLVNYVADIFAALPPVFLTPGNHDYLSPGGPYAPQERKRRGLRPWPDNVHIFSHEEFSTAYHPKRPEVAITGHAFHANQPVTAHRLAQRLLRDPAEISILLLHGSRTQFTLEEAQKITLPFTATELLQQGFSYSALGHYHSYSDIVDAQGNLRAAYAGRPFNAEFTHDHLGGLTGVITGEGAQEIRRFTLDQRRIMDIPVFCENAATPEELNRLAEFAFQKSDSGPEDLVRYRFTGTYIPGTRLRVTIPPERHFASAISFAQLRPGYDIKALLEAAEAEAASAESLYAKQMQQRLESASDDTERKAIRDALDYGMRALRGLPLQAADPTS